MSEYSLTKCMQQCIVYYTHCDAFDMYTFFVELRDRYIEAGPNALMHQYMGLTNLGNNAGVTDSFIPNLWKWDTGI